MGLKLTDPLRNLPLKEQLLAQAVAVELAKVLPAAIAEGIRLSKEVSDAVA